MLRISLAVLTLLLCWSAQVCASPPATGDTGQAAMQGDAEARSQRRRVDLREALKVSDRASQAPPRQLSAPERAALRQQLRQLPLDLPR